MNFDWMRFDQMAETLRYQCGAIEGGIDADYQKLFSPIARDNIHLTESGSDQTAECRQSDIPCMMSEGVINPLEMIDVEHQDGKIERVSF